MVIGFAPIANERAEVLILGTMPSVKSLLQQQYYGHPQNAFWRIIYSLWDQDPPEDYEQRKQFLLDQHIALWDVLMQCEREGSADSSILHPQANNFTWLAAQCPQIKAIIFNSKNAFDYYTKMVTSDPFWNLPKIVLPSTSPARAMKFEKKRDAWTTLRHILDKNA